MMGKVWPCLFGEDGNITVPIALLRKALGSAGDAGIAPVRGQIWG